MTIRLLCAYALLLLLVPAVQGQGSAGTAANIEPRFVVDMPTAGMLPEASFTLDLDFYQDGGVLTGLSFGLLQRLTVGLSYGGSKLIGSEFPDWNKYPGINLKVRLFEESTQLPAIALGFDSQGRDGYVRELDRYLIKSPGFFAVASRNYAWLGNMSIHGGLNYSLEHGDGDSDINGYVGAEKSIGTSLSLSAEYNLASNDSDADALGKGRGYLNFGLRWAAGSGLTLALNIKDVLRNLRGVEAINRTMRLEYAKFF